MSEPVSDPWIYVVTDIETDGPWPGPNSIRSIASVAVTADGIELDRYEAVLEPLPGSAPNPDTLAWFETVPESWSAATANPRPVVDVMNDYTTWLKQVPEPRMFAASPIAFDGGWIDYYLRRFSRYGLAQGPYEIDRVFQGPGLCLRSYAAAITGRPVADVSPSTLPSEWLGDVAHTHHAIDDALGYAHLLGELHRRATTHPPRSQ